MQRRLLPFVRALLTRHALDDGVLVIVAHGANLGFMMTVLALTFVFGGLRSAGRGARLMFGLVVGLGYYVLGEVLVSGGEVYDLDPLVVAWAPSALLLVVALVAFARIR